MDIFGFNIRRKGAQNLPSISTPIDDEGAINIDAGGLYGTTLDFDSTVKSEAELITKYREMSFTPEVDIAVDDIVNELVVYDDKDRVVEINLDNVPFNDESKELIKLEFERILNLLEFNKRAYEIVRRWYVDGRLPYLLQIDDKNPNMGIQGLQYLDPRKTKRVKEFNSSFGLTAQAVQLQNEYYLYNDNGFVGSTNGATDSSGLNQSALRGSTALIKLPVDSVVVITSGLMSSDDKMILSYLHKIMRPLNLLRNYEDSIMIYTMSRAPERRVFYIDTGNLPKIKAEQHVRDMMTKFKNKLVYDSNTGAIKDDRKFMTMLEDFWLPRREGGRGTEISILPGGAQIGNMAEGIEYFQRLLYKSLNIPISRLDPNAVFTLGRATELSRDEVKYAKFIRRLKMKFSGLFLKLLERQVVLKGMMTPEDWSIAEQNITFMFNKNNYYEELKETEIMNNRIALANDANQYLGVYFSREQIQKDILKQTDEEIEQIAEQNANDPFLQQNINNRTGVQR